MQGFTQKIVQMMKSEKLFQSQGGPIILSQVCISLLNVCVIEGNAQKPSYHQITTSRYVVLLFSRSDKLFEQQNTHIVCVYL